jgi:hypothetical protein
MQGLSILPHRTWLLAPLLSEENLYFSVNHYFCHAYGENDTTYIAYWEKKTKVLGRVG